jgi:hypothetical protein
VRKPHKQPDPAPDIRIRKERIETFIKRYPDLRDEDCRPYSTERIAKELNISIYAAAQLLKHRGYEIVNGTWQTIAKKARAVPVACAAPARPQKAVILEPGTELVNAMEEQARLKLIEQAKVKVKADVVLREVAKMFTPASRFAIFTTDEQDTLRKALQLHTSYHCTEEERDHLAEALLEEVGGEKIRLRTVQDVQAQIQSIQADTASCHHRRRGAPILGDNPHGIVEFEPARVLR